MKHVTYKSHQILTDGTHRITTRIFATGRGLKFDHRLGLIVPDVARGYMRQSFAIRDAKLRPSFWNRAIGLIFPFLRVIGYTIEIIDEEQRTNAPAQTEENGDPVPA